MSSPASSSPRLRAAQIAIVTVLVLFLVVRLADSGDGDGGSGTAAAAEADPLGSGRAVTLAFGGDVHFEDGLRGRLAADPARALDPLPRLLKGADLSIVNLETAVTRDGDCPDRQPKQFAFAAPESAFAALRSAGVTVASGANNHGMDCGRAGLEQTLAAARGAGVPLIGVGVHEEAAFKPFVVEKHGQRIAIVAASQVLDDELAAAWMAVDAEPGMATARDLGALVRAVREARATADTVVVFLHWGTELQQCPNPRQPPLARLLAAAGADVIAGSHAHVPLGAGYSGRTLVAYGLGNLAFYARGPPRTSSGVLTVTITGRRVDRYAWRPAVIEDGAPIPLRGAARDAAKAEWRALRGCTGLAARPSGGYLTAQ
ncbi:CapA family protein [Conexibacter woesei]|uniref:Capsule synthesis protein, CapA n=1 Tax=Conexibacter woesei (strain DSM 14684 / CCUG 47730 / CIP 108061 / JCM 11494 / NBRC 100937 / ID131577) TaxID=469383 RepID=D3F651_CONWI|nr:CapA family protein [Conexibacter woesei]ADB48724.1 Capsule synthesis protein, CapA [Conexibacter woesei DSM 14684]